MLKKLALAVLFVAVVAVARVEALFKGALHPNTTYMFMVEDLSGGATLMIQEVVRGRLEAAVFDTLGPAETRNLFYTVPNHATRVILVVDPTYDIGAKVTVFQDGTPIFPTQTYGNDHIELVFDVRP
jgi:hypothetical protein